MTWNPIVDFTEDPVGVWTLQANLGLTPGLHPYARVRLVRRGPEVGYRAETSDGDLIGYYRTLLARATASMNALKEAAARRRTRAVVNRDGC